MNTIIASDWVIFGTVVMISGFATALGIFIILYARLREKDRKANRNSNQSNSVNHKAQ